MQLAFDWHRRPRFGSGWDKVSSRLVATMDVWIFWSTTPERWNERTPPFSSSVLPSQMPATESEPRTSVKVEQIRNIGPRPEGIPSHALMPSRAVVLARRILTMRRRPVQTHAYACAVGPRRAAGSCGSRAHASAP
jgi:hypothetical protein